MSLVNPGSYDTVSLLRKGSSAPPNAANVVLWWGSDEGGGPVGLFVDEESALLWCRLKEIRVFLPGRKEAAIEGRVDT